MVRIGCLLLMSLLLLGCAGKGKKDPYQDMPADEIYETATKAVAKKRYTKAKEAYESLNNQYPFGDYTEKAQLDMIYVYYRSQELPSAFRAADRFIRLHPRSEYLDYAYYMRALIKATENLTFATRYLPLDLTKRDSHAEETGYVYFEEFLARFPNSPYAPDARQRLIYFRNHLAQQQVNIAQYYMKREAWLAAANRAQDVVEHYPQTPAVKEALAIMTKAYSKLGMDDLASHAKTVYELNS